MRRGWNGSKHAGIVTAKDRFNSFDFLSLKWGFEACLLKEPTCKSQVAKSPDEEIPEIRLVLAYQGHRLCSYRIIGIFVEEPQQPQV